MYREKTPANQLDRNRDALRLSLGEMKERQAMMDNTVLPDHPSAVSLQNILNELQKQIDEEDRAPGRRHFSASRGRTGSRRSCASARMKKNWPSKSRPWTK